MHIDHIAIWTNNLERMKDFYEKYFKAQAGSKYHNPRMQFESYFLTFPSGVRLELMTKPGIDKVPIKPDSPYIGYAHISFAAGSESGVNQLCSRLEQDGFEILDGPRRTGDGYYECVLLDPDGNLIEITA